MIFSHISCLILSTCVDFFTLIFGICVTCDIDWRLITGEEAQKDENFRLHVEWNFYTRELGTQIIEKNSEKSLKVFCIENQIFVGSFTAYFEEFSNNSVDIRLGKVEKSVDFRQSEMFFLSTFQQQEKRRKSLKLCGCCFFTSCDFWLRLVPICVRKITHTFHSYWQFNETPLAFSLHHIIIPTFDLLSSHRRVWYTHSVSFCFDQHLYYLRPTKTTWFCVEKLKPLLFQLDIRNRIV